VLLPTLLPSPLPLLLPLLLLLPLPATPVEPISVDKVNKGEDKNIEEPVEVEDKDVGLPLPLPPARFISVWKPVIGGGKESPPGIRLAVFNTKSIYYFELDEWQSETVLYLLPRKFKIT
jgi:hypothetical protein